MGSIRSFSDRVTRASEAVTPCLLILVSFVAKGETDMPKREEPPLIERRHGDRVHVSIPCSVRLLSGERRAVEIRDLSRTGCGVTAAGRLRCNTLVWVGLPSGRVPRARIVRSHGQEAAMEFMAALDPRDFELLAQVCSLVMTPAAHS